VAPRVAVVVRTADLRLRAATAALPKPANRFRQVLTVKRDDEACQAAVGSDVVATGELFERHTGHHHTAALLTEGPDDSRESGPSRGLP
jgi:hypothetical protein